MNNDNRERKKRMENNYIDARGGKKLEGEAKFIKGKGKLPFEV